VTETGSIGSANPGPFEINGKRGKNPKGSEEKKMLSNSPQGKPSSTAAPLEKVPSKGWITLFAGIATNLCLGILYAFSVWKAALLANKDHIAGSVMGGMNAGWQYLSDSQATWAFSLCTFVFCAFMFPGGRIQDKLGPRVSVTIGGLSLALGCIISGLMRSYTGLILGFGIFGGMGIGIGYAGPIPAAMKWFGPHRRGLVAGLVVGGFGGAAIYISALAGLVIKAYGISNSFYIMGVLFSVVIIIAGRLLYTPPEGYAPPAPAASTRVAVKTSPASDEWTVSETIKTWQCFVFVLMGLCGSQAGLLVAVNATPMLFKTAFSLAFFAANAWLIASYGGFMNMTGRIGTGFYSDKIGRKNAYVLNSLLCAVCLFLTPSIMRSGNVFLLFLTVGISYWQLGGTMSILPAMTADYFGQKNLGTNYGLIFFLGSVSVFMAQIGAFIKDTTGSLDYAFYISGTFLLVGIGACIALRKPVKKKAEVASPALQA
jgi:OFA family oxalate/formate antiporter-like MFS transporter